MKWGDLTWELVTGAIIVAVIYMLVRPGSPAASAVEQVSAALSALVATATQYQYNPGGSTSGS